MRPAQRVESQAAVPLLETYASCLGITIVDSYLYVFYSNTIRVYEHFSQKFMPELSEELIVSQRKIVRFAVNTRYIAMLFEDSKIQIRSREHWERVQYSFNLTQEPNKIGKFTLNETKLIYQYFDEQAKCNIYGFVSLGSRYQENSNIQTLFWSTPSKFDQLTNLAELGNIENFYFALTENQIKFGTYYKLENTKSLQSFEFGSMKQENRLNKVLFFSILSLSNNTTGIKDEYCPAHGRNLYIVKLIDENKPLNKRLILKYRKFYEHVTSSQKQCMDSEEKRLEAYTKMMNTLLQINSSKLEEDSAHSQNSELNQSRDSSYSSSKSKNAKFSKSMEISLQKDEKFYNLVDKKEFIYFSTNQRVFKFTITQDNGEMNGKVQQILRLDKDSRFIEACQNNLYITVSNICVTSCGQKFETVKIMEPKRQKQKQETKSVEIQTQVLTDILLDQMQQKQLTKMIDNLLEKKDVVDIQTQTQPSEQMQIPTSKIKVEQMTQNRPIAAIKSYNQISIGETLPMCPDSHQETLRKINSNLLQIQNSLHQETMKKFQQFVRKEQSKTKQQIEKKVQQLVGTAISSSVIPAIEAFIRQVFEAKLQEVNVYLYSLTMENLLLMKQEIQKDQVKENTLRIELIKRQLYEVAESKKAVAQMVEICKKKEIQKIVFFEEVKKKFVEIQHKVQFLEGKVKAMVEGEQMNEAKLYDQIEKIKAMLKGQVQIKQPSRKKSTVSVSQQKQQKQHKVEEQAESSQAASENQESDEVSESEIDQSQVAQEITDSEIELSSKVVAITRHQISEMTNSRPYPYQSPYHYPYQHPHNFRDYYHYPPQMPPQYTQYTPYPPPPMGGYGYEMGPRTNPSYGLPRVQPRPEFIPRLKNPPDKREEKKKHKKREK